MIRRHDKNCARDAALPPVYVTTRDFGRLENLARTHLQVRHPVAKLLAAELDRAIVCQPDAILPDVATMNARVVFRTSDGGILQSAILVYPHQYHPSGQYVSVLSPLGAALVGLRAGSRMHYADLQGVRQELMIEKIAYQPEAEERARG